MLAGSFLRSTARATRGRKRSHRVGWITAHAIDTVSAGRRFGTLGSAVDMRVTNNARWINKHSTTIWNELYDSRCRYDTVIFFKAMDPACQEEARRIKDRGGRVVFDANVNYYEIWGTYDLPGTCPTDQQRRDAVEMTSLADDVVADSTYILDRAREYNTNSVWIPDNVDLTVFKGTRTQKRTESLRLVWSGRSRKSQHLLMLRDVLSKLPDVQLVLVSDDHPTAMQELQEVVPCEFIRYSDRNYARALLGSDVIISPKVLNNGYEMGHTEYKITLGMAVGLPAVASPQRSYIEAIEHRGGGIIAETEEDWFLALSKIASDAGLRADLGEKARLTVLEKYSTPVVAQLFLDLLEG